jgi:hypothetical protein
MGLIEIANAGTLSDAPTVLQVGERVLNFLLQMFGVVAIIAVLGSGILYITSFGDESRMQMAKRWLIWVVVGVIVGLGALVIIRQIVSILG